jgi:thioredoxin 1
MGPIFQQLADEYTDKVNFVKVDTDVHEDTVDTFSIQGLPLFGLFVKGKMVSAHSGALTRDALRDFINKGLDS